MPLTNSKDALFSRPVSLNASLSRDAEHSNQSSAQPVESPRLTLTLEQVLTVSVHSIALTDGDHVAVLADEPRVRNAKGWRSLPLSPALQPKAGENDEVEIFFGRDFEPRIMGTRHASDGERPVYLRHVNGVWRDGREEIGQLGSANRGDLWGELGTIDPELVCRTNAVCLIKRNTGWVTAPAGNVRRRVQLVSDGVWGLDASGLATIDAKGWHTNIAAPAWLSPRAFWTSGSDAWVADGEDLFHFSGGAWSKEHAPIAEPHAFWGLTVNSVWLVGKGGVAHFDGKSWHLLDLPGPLDAVCGRTDSEVWLGGNLGLFRARL